MSHTTLSIKEETYYELDELRAKLPYQNTKSWDTFLIYLAREVDKNE